MAIAMAGNKWFIEVPPLVDYADSQGFRGGKVDAVRSYIRRRDEVMRYAYFRFCASAFVASRVLVFPGAAMELDGAVTVAEQS